MTPRTSISNGKNNLDPEKKSSKKTAHSVSSGLPTNFSEKDWLFGFPMFDKLPEQSKKYINHHILKQVIKSGYNENDGDVFEYIAFANIIRPFRGLNKFILNCSRRTEALISLHEMLYVPFTISEESNNYSPEDYRKTRNYSYFLRRLTKQMIKCKLLTILVLEPGVMGIPYNKRFWTTYLYYNPNILSEEDLITNDFAIGIVQRKIWDSKIGRPEDQIPPKKLKDKFEPEPESEPEPERIGVFELCPKCLKSIDTKEFFLYHGGKRKMCVTCAKKEGWIRD